MRDFTNHAQPITSYDYYKVDSMNNASRARINIARATYRKLKHSPVLSDISTTVYGIISQFSDKIQPPRLLQTAGGEGGGSMNNGLYT